MSTQIPGPGWQPDPGGAHEHRYWDGLRWTDHVADGGVQGSSAVSAPAPAVVGVPRLYPGMPKSKTTAILLAVFLAFWTWIYTFKLDAWKFWLNLGLTVITVGIWGVLVSWPWAIIDAARRSDDWYAQFPNGDLIRLQALGAAAPKIAYTAVPAATLPPPPPPASAPPPPPLFL